MYVRAAPRCLLLLCVPVYNIATEPTEDPPMERGIDTSVCTYVRQFRKLDIWVTVVSRSERPRAGRAVCYAMLACLLRCRGCVHSFLVPTYLDVLTLCTHCFTMCTPTTTTTRPALICAKLLYHVPPPPTSTTTTATTRTAREKETCRFLLQDRRYR